VIVECRIDCIVNLIADTKDQWARDDPAFLVLLTFWLFGNLISVMFSLSRTCHLRCHCCRFTFGDGLCFASFI